MLPPEADSTITMMNVTEKPDVSYNDIGGMDIQKQEIREAVELPLSHFELYQQIGIDPPRGENMQTLAIAPFSPVSATHV